VQQIFGSTAKRLDALTKTSITQILVSVQQIFCTFQARDRRPGPSPAHFPVSLPGSQAPGNPTLEALPRVSAGLEAPASGDALPGRSLVMRLYNGNSLVRKGACQGRASCIFALGVTEHRRSGLLLTATF